tara:strand:- start:133 stop:1104 length:972 start_codon:yes stop_codon:yes gene_type:complete
MSEEQTIWNDVEVPAKVEYEIEEQEQKVTKPVVETKESLIKAEAPEEDIKELDGIETNGAQKRIRQLVKQRKERDEHIHQLIQDKESLNSKLQQREQTFVNTQKITTDNTEKNLLEKVDLAKTNYLEAYNAGDGEKVLQSLEVLQRVQLDLDNVNKQKNALDNYNKEMEQKAAVQKQQPQQTAQKPDIKAQTWAGDNDWFGENSVMTASALAIDAELKEMGYDPAEDDFYGEIDRRMRTEFPHKFQEDQEEEEIQREQPTKQVAQVVAGTSRSPSTSSKKIKLSQEDVRLAQKWNIPLEVYAAEKLKVNSSDGEYTTINYRGS